MRGLSKLLRGFSLRLSRYIKLVLHFVGDLHQPLHSSDNDGRGGNDVKVMAEGVVHHSHDELHGYWNTQFVDGIAPSSGALATKLLGLVLRDLSHSHVAFVAPS
jgi:S1/P1 Nuclease